MTAAPFFTIIIATYNAEATVLKSLESVLSQTEQAQVVLVDGLSKDRTMELVRPYQAKGVEIICERDEGVYDAWNKGLRKAKGEWIIFLGADDFYPHPDCLAVLRRHLIAASPETEVAYGRVHVVDSAGTPVVEENGPWEKCAARLLTNMPYTHVGSAHRKRMFTNRNFNSSYKIAGDYHFLYPSLAGIFPIFVENYPVHMGNGGLSTNTKSRIQLLNEIKSIRKEYKISVLLNQKIWTELKLIYFKINIIFGRK